MLIDVAIKDIQEAISAASQMVSDSVYIGGDMVSAEDMPAVLIQNESYSVGSEIRTPLLNKKNHVIGITLFCSAETSNHTLLTLSLLRTEIENILATMSFTDASIYEFIQTGCSEIESPDSTSKGSFLKTIYSLRA